MKDRPGKQVSLLYGEWSRNNFCHTYVEENTNGMDLEIAYE